MSSGHEVTCWSVVRRDVHRLWATPLKTKDQVRILEYISRSKTHYFILECVEYKEIQVELFTWMLKAEVLRRIVMVSYSK